MLYKAYSLVTVKGFDPVKRTFTGTATAAAPDRIGDVIESAGVTFRNPMPLLMHHNSQKPVGEATFGRYTETGTPFSARISTLDRDSGVVKERLDEAVDSLAAQPPLIRGVSIGFRPLVDPVYIKETGGFRFPKIEVLELSMVTVPAHQSATIDLIKQLDTAQRAQSGTVTRVISQSASAVASGVPFKKESHMVTPISDQVTSAQAELQKKSFRLNELIELEAADGTLEDAQIQERDGLTKEVDDLSGKVNRLKVQEKAQAAMAQAPIVRAPQGDVRDAGRTQVVMGASSEQKLPAGIEFARYMICRMAALKTGLSPLDLAKHYYPENARIQMTLKEAIPAASTQDSTWAGPLVYPTNLVNEFIEFLRPQTIIGRIDSFTRVAFNSRITGQTSGGSGYWVGEGKAKPLTKFDFNAVTIPFTKVANIAVLSDELIRFSNPSAEARVRNELARSAQERLDIDFIDPAKTASAGVSPASITNGITNLNSSGVTLDAVDVDVQAMMSAFIQNHIMPTHWIMPNTVALSLSMMRTSLGNYAFPTVTMNGGTFYGLPVITSQYAILGTPANNLIVLLSAPDIFLADDGGFSIDVSREASLEMDDAPTMDAGSLGSPAGATGTSVVSMFQTNCMAVRCEREIYWARRRNAGVVWMDDVQWAAGTQ